MTAMKSEANGKPKANAKPKSNGKPKAAKPKVSAMQPSGSRALAAASPPRTPDDGQYGGVLAGLIR